MTLRLVPFAVASALLLAGCSVGPDYVKPTAPTPAAYKESAPTADPGVWKAAAPGDAKLRADWWAMFGDTELNTLEQRLDGENQDLKASEARFREARVLIGVSQSALYPNVSLAPQIATLRDSKNQPYAPKIKTDGEFILPLDASYEIDLWGRIRRGVTVAREQAQVAAADLQTASLALHAELALDYIELRAADRQKQLLDNTVKAYEDALELTRNRANGGGAPESDVAEAQTQLDTARVQDTDIAVQRAQFEHAIAVLVGVAPSELKIDPAPLNIDPPPLPLGLPSDLLQRRPDIASAERRIAIANERIGIARAAYYPSVVLGGTGGFEGETISNWLNWPSLFWAVGATMTETLFDGGRRDAVSEAARDEYDATVADYRQTTLDAFQQVEDNIAALRILETEEKQQDAAVASAQNALHLFTDRYIGGADTYLQVITAQTAALSNERNYVDILRRRNVASILLVKALGGGWSDAEMAKLASDAGSAQK